MIFFKGRPTVTVPMGSIICIANFFRACKTYKLSKLKKSVLYVTAGDMYVTEKNMNLSYPSIRYLKIEYFLGPRQPPRYFLA